MTKLTPVKTTINFLHCYIQDDRVLHKYPTQLVFK